MTKAVLITNDQSGAHLAGTEDKGVVRGWLEDGGVRVTALTGSVGEQIEKSRESDADIVVVDGGDGTISATIAAHVGTDRPVGIIPGGTMNFLAADYGVPLDREVAARAIHHCEVRAFDAGKIGDRVFLHTAFTGLPARLGVHREHLRGRLRLIDRLRLGLHALGTVGRDQRLKLETDDPDVGQQTFSSGTFAFVVGSVHGVMLPRPQREHQSGVLTAFAIDAKNGLDLARLTVRGALGDLDNDALVTRRLIRRGLLTGRRRITHAMLDGEGVRLPLPARLDLLTGAVKVIVPPDHPPAAGPTPVHETTDPPLASEQTERI